MQKIALLALILAIFWAFGFALNAEETENQEKTDEKIETEAPDKNSENINELKREVKQKNEEIKKLEEEAQKYREEITSKQQMGKTLKEELGRIEKTIKQLKNDIYITEKKIQKTELEIKETSLEINKREASLEKLRGGLVSLLQRLAERDKISILAILLKYNFVSAFFQQLDYSGILKKNILSSLDILRAAQKELQTQKTIAERKKNDLTNLKKSIGDRRKYQEETKKRQKELLAETKNQEKKYQELLLEQEKKRSALEDEIREIEAKLEITINSALLPQRGSGVLGWPLPTVSLTACFKGLNELKNCITQFFGYTSFAAVGGYNGKGHNGVDFRSALGTQILAAEDGIIENIGDTDLGCRKASYGKWILIHHPNNLSTLYAHLAAIGVYTGQQVKRGDYIGLSGVSGYATGPHLHFGVFITQAVEIKTIKSKVCGRSMTLPVAGRDPTSNVNGYLNPLDYL